MVPADAIPNKSETPVSGKKVKKAPSRWYFRFQTGNQRLLLCGQDTADPGFSGQKAYGISVHPPRQFGKTLNMDMLRVF